MRAFLRDASINVPLTAQAGIRDIADKFLLVFLNSGRLCILLVLCLLPLCAAYRHFRGGSARSVATVFD